MVAKKTFQITLGVAILILVSGAVWLVFEPLEKFRCLRDRHFEETAGKFLTATDSYYKEFFEYPWGALAEEEPRGAVVQDSWLRELVDKEAETASLARYSYWDRIFIAYQDGVLYACFVPLSRTFKEIADTQGRWQDGSTGCTEGCFSCVLRNE